MKMQIKKDILSILRGNKAEMANISQRCYDVDYLDELITTSKSYKLTQNILSLLANSEFGQDNKCICEKYEYFKQVNDDAVHRQLQTIKCIEDILQKKKVMWIKGMPLSTILYDDPFFRRSGDIDFIVESEEQKEFVKLLESRGFKKIGILNDDLGLRFSVHYHEIQLMSPYDVLVEIKVISGEMNIFKKEDMISDFWAHTELIDICGYKFETFDLMYTLIHLYLSAFSNSTAWYDVKSNGIRDLYEIMLFSKKYKIDYNRLFYISNLYGINSIVRETMKKINVIFDKVFQDSVISIFEREEANQHMMDKLYTSFLKYYDLGYIDELFNIQKRTEAYFAAISKAYYLEDINFTDNFLSQDILEYSLAVQNDKLRLELYLDSKYLYSTRENLFVLKFLCNDEEVTNKYGYTFVFFIVLKEGKAKGVLKNELEVEKAQEYSVRIESDLIEEKGVKTHFVYHIGLPFLSKSNKKICYNVQLSTRNENDQSNFFDLTILCPQKNTLPIFHTEYLRDIVI